MSGPDSRGSEWGKGNGSQRPGARPGGQSPGPGGRFRADEAGLAAGQQGLAGRVSRNAFDTFLVGVSSLLVLFFVVLMGSMLAELFSRSFRQTPHMDEVLFALRLSLVTATLSSMLAMAVSIPVAYMLSRFRFPGRNLVDTLLDLPIVLSPIALGAMLLIFFNTPWGSALEGILGPVVFEAKGIVLAQFIVVVGLSVRLLKTTFESIDVEYENLARSLGHTRARVFVRVVLPMARKGLVAAFLLVWGRAMGEFGATITLAGATTMKTETIPVAIYLSLESVDISSALVFITILVCVSMGVLFSVRKLDASTL